MNIHRIYEQFESMPMLLRITAIASVVIGVTLPMPMFMPEIKFSIAGSTLSHEEIWSSGIAFAMVVESLLMLIVGVGVFYRFIWVRYLLVALPVLQYFPFQVVHWLFNAPNPSRSFTIYVSFCALWAMAAYIYLFKTNSAKRYYENA